MSAYTEKFKSTKWQKKRLEALEYYSFLCCSCEEKEKELHVHHRHYIKGRQPWEYEIDDLVVLCSDCHKTWHDAKEQIDIIIGNITDTDTIYRIIGYALAVSADVWPRDINGLNIVGFVDAFRTNKRTVGLLIKEAEKRGAPIGNKFISEQML